MSTKTSGRSHARISIGPSKVFSVTSGTPVTVNCFVWCTVAPEASTPMLTSHAASTPLAATSTAPRVISPRQVMLMASLHRIGPVLPSRTRALPARGLPAG
jgi:hypothetical protein